MKIQSFNEMLENMGAYDVIEFKKYVDFVS